MASSVRVEYDVTALEKQLDERLADEIKDAREKFAAETDLITRQADWRKEQETAVRRLNRNLKAVSDDELESFRIKSKPTSKSRRWGATPESERDEAIENAHAKHAGAVKRLKAMKHTPEESIWLSRNMLRDWFGL